MSDSIKNERLIDEFSNVWNSVMQLNIPPHKAMKKRPRFRALYQLWEDSKFNGKDSRTAALNVAQIFTERQLKHWPRYELIADNILTAYPTSINELHNAVNLPPSVAMLSKIHTKRPAAEYLQFNNVNCIFGNTGAAIWKMNSVDPISMLLIKPHRLKNEPNKSIDEAILCYDRYGAGNICHFLYDVVGRYLDFINTSWRKTMRKPVLIMHLGSVKPFQLHILRTLNIPFLEVNPRQSFYINKLYVSSDVTGDFSEGFSHPARLARKETLGLLRSGVISGITDKPLIKKLYISREDSAVRQVKNEDCLMALLSKFGFEKIIMSEHSPKIQLALFSQATHIIAPHGAGLTSGIAVPLSCRILELMNPHKATDAFILVSKSLGIKHDIHFLEPVPGNNNHSATADLHAIEEWLNNNSANG